MPRAKRGIQCSDERLGKHLFYWHILFFLNQIQVRPIIEILKYQLSHLIDSIRKKLFIK